jgi:hypothetical protein
MMGVGDYPTSSDHSTSNTSQKQPSHETSEEKPTPQAKIKIPLANLKSLFSPQSLLFSSSNYFQTYTNLDLAPEFQNTVLMLGNAILARKYVTGQGLPHALDSELPTECESEESTHSPVHDDAGSDTNSVTDVEGWGKIWEGESPEAFKGTLPTSFQEYLQDYTRMYTPLHSWWPY